MYSNSLCLVGGCPDDDTSSELGPPPVGASS